MYLDYRAVICIFLIADWWYCNGDWGSQHVVYTVYNVNKTWNEAKEICYASKNSMLSMANDTIWKFWKNMFFPTTTVPHRTLTRFWFGLHTNPANHSELYWDDCRIPDWLEWTQNRSLYIPLYPCLAFDVDYWPYTTVQLKLWLGAECTDRLRFICVWEDDCIYQTCEEYLIILSQAECNTACTMLQNTGEIANVATCKSRLLLTAPYSVCHVYQLPGSVPEGESFSICYKTQVDVSIKRCASMSVSLNLSTFINTNSSPLSNCPVQHQYSTIVAETTTESEVTHKDVCHDIDEKSRCMLFTETAAPDMCQCPCTGQESETNFTLTMEERIENLKKELTIDKKQTSNNKRKRISVMDNRTTAKGLGVCGLAILILVPVCLVLMDLTSFSYHWNYFCRRKVLKVRKHPIQNNVTTCTKLASNTTSVGNIRTAFAKNKPPQNMDFVNNTYNKKTKNAAQDCKNQQSRDVNINEQSESINPSTMLCIRPKTANTPNVHVVNSGILDLKYQSSMLASRVLAHEIKSGKRKLIQCNVSDKSNNIIEENRDTSA